MKGFDKYRGLCLATDDGTPYAVVGPHPDGGLLIRPMALPEPPPCATCGKARAEFPSIFRNDPCCCVLCAKAAAQ